jgi:tRNA modification GTPase
MLNHDSSIIIALSSAAGIGDRGIIRFSGGNCIEIVAASCINKEEIKNGKGFHSYKSVLSILEIPIPVSIYLMRVPASYTRENMVELHLPGSPFILSKIVSYFISHFECRIAEPGEFTKRAFFNGRLDLVQAESVTRLIAAKSDREYRKALDALTGRVTNMIAPLREKLFFMARDLTVDLDFDEEIEQEHLDNIKIQLEEIKIEVSKIAIEVQSEQITEDEYRVILCGPVNAGKSTIFNQFSEESIAIVSDIRGTTRDIIKREITLNDVSFVLHDCPGWGEAVDEIDAQAQAQSSLSVQTADMVIGVLDGTVAFNKQKPEKRPEWSGRCILVINKSDLPLELNVQEALEFFQMNELDAVFVSGKTNIKELQKKVIEKWNEYEQSAVSSTLNARQQQEILIASHAIEMALDALALGLGVDAVEFEVRRSLYALSRVTGDEVDENILTSIFESFCIGK